MKIYVINLKRRTDRKEQILKQFEDLGVDNYEIIEAIDGKELDNPDKHSNVRLMKRFSFELTETEIACALSHNLAYQKIIDSGERGIILEDDVIIDGKFTEMIDIDIPSDVDLLMYGYFTSNIQNEHSKPQSYNYELQSRIKTEIGDDCICYFKDSCIDLNNNKFYKIDEQSYNVDMLHGAHAYSPSINFCKTVLTIQKKIVFAADDIWNNLAHFSIHNLNCYAPLQPVVIQSSEFTSDLAEGRQTKHHSDYIKERMSSENFGI